MPVVIKPYKFGVKESPSADMRPTEDFGRFKVTNTAAAQLGIALNNDEAVKIRAFLLTLNGKQPKIFYPNYVAQFRYHPETNVTVADSISTQRNI